MKLLMQSDDYGMTPAVARGIVDGIEKGILRNTGMFMN
ncbi:MAG: ChbG/HpnK family deacetylase, partial [Holdemania filiformis]